MNKGWSLFFIIVLVVAAWGFYEGMKGVGNSDSKSNARIEIEDSVAIEENRENEDTSSVFESLDLPSDNNSGDTKVFVITGENFKYIMNGEENPDIKVKQGDMVKIEFTSTEGFHDWVVDEFAAATDRVMAVNSTSVEFVADKKGTFEYYCSVGKHRENGMKGNLIVE